jgi:hypothetical protein
MKKGLRPVQEIQSVIFMSIFSYVILSVAESGISEIIFYTLGQITVFVSAIIAHEYGHYLAARSAGVPANIEWLPQPTVTCGKMSDARRRLVAVSGPVTGAIVSIIGISILIVSLGLPPMLFAIAGSMAVVQLSMLFPNFADGKALFSN